MAFQNCPIYKWTLAETIIIIITFQTCFPFTEYTAIAWTLVQIIFSSGLQSFQVENEN